MQKLFNVLVILSLLFPVGMVSASNQQPVVSSQSDSDLFLTWVKVADALDMTRLKELGAVVVSTEAGKAQVIANADTLEQITRLGFQPNATDIITSLVGKSLSSTTTLSDLSLDDIKAVDDLMAVDDDADGLTNTQESWWCTNPLDADSDDDGILDGVEIQTAKDWMNNRRSGPAFDTPWASWPFNDTTCPDKDFDSIPNLAERWELGLNMDLESTDRDKFDDGQELFGVTYCPGGDASCGYGDLPRSTDTGYVGSTIPSWVKAPGNHPLVTAHPLPEIDVVPSSLNVETVTVVTTDHVISSGTERSFSTAKTEGTSTSVSNTINWNEWQEVSNTTALLSSNPFQFDYKDSKDSSGANFYLLKSGASILSMIGGVAGLATCGVTFGLGCALAVASFSGGALGFTVTQMEALDSIQENAKNNKKITNTPLLENIQEPANDEVVGRAGSDSNLQNNGLNGGGTRLYEDSSGLINVSNYFPINFPTFQPTQTESKGQSWGGAQTTTTEHYEEHTVTNGEAFSSEESWGMAVAVDSAHAADLWFSYTVKNSGTDLAREISNLAFNVYLNSDPNPICTYFVGSSVCGSPVGSTLYTNFEPGETHTYTSLRIPLSLEQMKQIDLGGKLRIVVEDFSFGVDEYFYNDALNGNVQLAIEDGTEDGDETIDRYLIPAYADDSVIDILARYFPYTIDEVGSLTAVWTPEYRSDVPAWCASPQVVGTGANQTVWCKHALTTADWWNIYTNNLGDGSLSLQETPAVGGSTALFRFNADSDLDGYSDRSEDRLGSDPYNAADFPQPEILAGVHSNRINDNVISTLSLINTGLYDAYGVEAIMVAPDDSITITNNTVGGSGRVRTGKEVVVGSRILSPILGTWTGTAKPTVGGYYTGTTDKIYTFTAVCSNPAGCPVGSETWTLSWNDGTLSGSINFGVGYQSPTLLNIGSAGLKLGMLSGTVFNGNTFTIQARTPRDTFQYTINREPYSQPIVIVSYNDPQGNHRFMISDDALDLASPTTDLLAFSGQMLDIRGVEIVTSSPFSAGENSNHLVVDNPSGKTLQDSNLFLDFIDPTGTVVAEVVSTQDLTPGPAVVEMIWDTASFDPVYDPDQDYIVMAFWTDYEGNILDVVGRPLSSFQQDPQAMFAMSEADATWDFGSIPQGSLLKRTFTFANTGERELLTYVEAPVGLSVSQLGSREVSVADQTSYDILLNTEELAEGAFEQTVSIHTSDPSTPTRIVTVSGTITAGESDTPTGSLQRPLDYLVTVPGPQTQGTWYSFEHPIGPEPQTIHPVKVFSEDYGQLWGVGKYATAFNAGTSSYEMFGDGRDGTMPTSGNLDNNNGFGFSIVNSGVLGSYQVNVTDAASGWRINPGDVVLIHQTQGTNAGCWEMNKAISDYLGGIANIQLEKPLQCNYVSGGSNHAQIMRVPQYSYCSVSGNVTPLAPWNGTWGGIFAVLCNGDMSIAGSIQANGGTGSKIASIGNCIEYGGAGIGYGFRGGNAFRSHGANDCGWPTNVFHAAQQGESPQSNGIWSDQANGSGGGAGPGDNSVTGGGGGGGYGTNGQTGGGSDGASRGGIGGGIIGTVDLARLYLGSGGGGGQKWYAYGPGGGGGGGGIVYIAAKQLNIIGSITVNGGSGASADQPGGGGSGGSILLHTSNATLGSSRVTANGGAAGIGQALGGAGGVGRIRIEYCDSISGSSSPVASTQKLNCYIAEQLETSPTITRLNLPQSYTSDTNYAIQYGRKMVFNGAGSQTNILRMSGSLLSSATLDTLISGVGTGSLTVDLDIGDDDSIDYTWTGDVTDSNPLNDIDLTQAFNRWWAANGRPTTEDMDVPVKVSLSKAGQVLLTDLKINSAGSVLRNLQLEDGSYDSVLLSYILTGASGPITIGVDVGDDGIVDDTYISESPSNPQSVTSGNLSDAINEYLDTIIGEGDVDIPVRFYIPSGITLQLDSFTTDRSGSLDLNLTPTDIQLPPGSPTEGAEIPVSVTLHNSGNLPSGGVVATFYATAPGWGEWYIGSHLVENVPPGGTASAQINWKTLGFNGNVPLRVVVDAYNRVDETNEENNSATSAYTILTRPDLSFESISLSDPEPVTGETIQVNLPVNDSGQTSAGNTTVKLFSGNPAEGGLLIGEQIVSVSATSQSSALVDWTPGAPGIYRLFAVEDNENVINESIEGNNLYWKDIHVGFATPLILDSGVLSEDPAYSLASGFGVIDSGLPDVLGTCGVGEAWENSFRRDPDGLISYQFDHLQPNHFYHLDLVLYECDSAGRQESITVDGMELAGPIDLGDGLVHRLSLRLDPALYRDNQINIHVLAPGADGVVVSAVNLHDIDYRYADSGGGNDPQYPGSRGFGWLDGTANTSYGTLPYQSGRVDQNDNTVQYRFDNLEIGKEFDLDFTFWQSTGTGRIQKIKIDGVDTGVTVDTSDYLIHRERIPVPANLYQADNSVIVSIERTNASTGAMVNEIALEERTIFTGQPLTCDHVKPTPYFTDSYGYLSYFAMPGQIGQRVEALNPRGDVIGCYIVDTAGQYGFMRIFGEDTSTNPITPGMRAGEKVTYRVSGFPAYAEPELYFQDDHVSHFIDLEVRLLTEQTILLSTGWNLIGLNVESPTPLVSFMLGTLSSRVDRLVGEYGVYSPILPDPFVTLKEIHSGKGFYTLVNGTTSVNWVVAGEPISDDTVFDLHAGWNWIGGIKESMAVETALSSIAGKYRRVISLTKTYDTSVPPSFNTLINLVPKEGYLIYMTEAGQLVYPYGVQSPQLVSDKSDDELCGGVQPTPRLSIVYGEVNVNGAAAPVGTRIEFITPRGEIAGCAVIEEAGLLKLTSVYGADGGIPGFESDEVLLVRLNGISGTFSEPAIWQDDKDVHEISISTDWLTCFYR